MQNPNAFWDFDISYWKGTRVVLLASGATLASPKGRQWKLCISKSTGTKIIDGFVIDLKAVSLTAPPAAGIVSAQRV